MKQNLVHQHYTPEQWAQVDTAIDTLALALEPFLVGLSVSQRRFMVKMGDGSEAFVRNAVDVIADNLALLPRGFELEEMKRDLASHDALQFRLTRLTKLMDKSRHTQMALGSDAMVAALDGYNILKRYAESEGFDTLRRTLGKRFSGQGARSEEVPPPV